jgi:hypothetical protein
MLKLPLDMLESISPRSYFCMFGLHSKDSKLRHARMEDAIEWFYGHPGSDLEEQEKISIMCNEAQEEMYDWVILESVTEEYVADSH